MDSEAVEELFERNADMRLLELRHSEHGRGPTSLREVSTAQPNCVIDGENGLADPTNPFSGAALVGYAIRRVTFADGTSWIEPGANPWPAAGA